MLRLTFKRPEMDVLIQSFSFPSHNSGGLAVREYTMIKLILKGMGKRFLKQILTDREKYQITFNEVECVAITAYFTNVALRQPAYEVAVLSDLYMKTHKICLSIS